ncbi:MAG: PQQ-dependent sugar dehydrogenase [Gammaproteobacteria bacterium]|nr:PQQ-dependent sugar dehydrogenase [Gammaproteobacteria bacterium]
MRRDTAVQAARATLLALLLTACGGDGSLGSGGGGSSGGGSSGGGSGGGGSGGGTAPVVDVERVFPNLEFAAPVTLLQAPGAAGRWYVVEQAGVVRAFANDNAVTAGDVSTLLDIRARVVSGGETGLLGMVFHPDYPADPRVFVCYTGGTPLESRVAEFRSADGGTTLDPASERVLLRVTQPQSNHNGGHLVFGPEGYLYVGLGDGGGGGDPHGSIGNGQDTHTLLGKILRIDVDAQPYGIPAGNPFAASNRCGAGGSGAADCAEIYAWGLRNPWRFNFDVATGQLWIGDVGQDAWEEIDRIVAPANLGWRCREGAHDFTAACGSAQNLVDPVAEYDHAVGESVTGGFVYRGSRYPTLVGRYVFGDFISQRLWSIPADTPAASVLAVSGGSDAGFGIAGFGVGVDGELYALSYSPGTIHHVLVR